MRQFEREISKEIFDRGVENGTITGDDFKKVFRPQEYQGYGIYSQHLFEKDGKYFVKFELGDTCD